MIFMQGPNFLGTKFLRAQISWGPKFFEDQISWGPNFLGTKKVRVPIVIGDQIESPESELRQ